MHFIKYRIQKLINYFTIFIADVIKVDDIGIDLFVSSPRASALSIDIEDFNRIDMTLNYIK